MAERQQRSSGSSGQGHSRARSLGAREGRTLVRRAQPEAIPAPGSSAKLRERFEPQTTTTLRPSTSESLSPTMAPSISTPIATQTLRPQMALPRSARDRSRSRSPSPRGRAISSSTGKQPLSARERQARSAGRHQGQGGRRASVVASGSGGRAPASKKPALSAAAEAELLRQKRAVASMKTRFEGVKSADIGSGGGGSGGGSGSGGGGLGRQRSDSMPFIGEGGSKAAQEIANARQRAMEQERVRRLKEEQGNKRRDPRRRSIERQNSQPLPKMAGRAGGSLSILATQAAGSSKLGRSTDDEFGFFDDGLGSSNPASAASETEASKSPTIKRRKSIGLLRGLRGGGLSRSTNTSDTEDDDSDSSNTDEGSGKGSGKKKKKSRWMPLSARRSGSQLEARNNAVTSGSDSASSTPKSARLGVASLPAFRDGRRYSVDSIATISAGDDPDDTWTSVKVLPEEWASSMFGASLDQTPLVEVKTVDEDGPHYNWELGGRRLPAEEETKKASEVPVQDPMEDVPWYCEFIAGSDHANWVGGSRQEPVVVSIQSKRADKEKNHYRVLVRTRTEDTRLFVTGSSSKERLKSLRATMPELEGIKLSNVGCGTEVVAELEKFERQLKSDMVQYKIGVLYMKRGQTTDDEMFCNQTTSPDYEEFLGLLGDQIELEGWDKFRGGLDVKTNTTGMYSIYTQHRGYEVMFHVSTMLPFTEGDAQQLERKRHLGNDIVVVVFKEADQPFDPYSIKSQFNHVFIVVERDHAIVMSSKQKKRTRYRVAVVAKDGVVPIRPFVPQDAVFEAGAEFREWLLTKIINGERCARYAPDFLSKTVRTRRMVLSHLVSTFGELADD